MVSVTGIAGTAAPVLLAASIARAISAGVTNGRAASWISTMSGASRGEGLEAGMNGSLARGAAICRRADSETRRRPD